MGDKNILNTNDNDLWNGFLLGYLFINGESADYDLKQIKNDLNAIMESGKDNLVELIQIQVKLL